MLFGFFLTEACGIEARAMGWIMAASLLLNALVDLVAGAAWRRRVTQVDGAGRLQARGTPLVCSFFLSFCATPLVPVDYRIIWALAMLLGFRATYPLLDIPQNAIAALLPLSDHARWTLLARRNVASGAASIVISMVVAPLLIGGSDMAGWIIWAWTLSLFVCASAWWLGLSTSPEASLSSPGSSARTEAGPRFGTILCALAVMIAASATFRLIEPYYAASAGSGIGLLLWAAIGGTCCQPVWASCRRRWSVGAVLSGAAILLTGGAMVLTSPLRSSPIGAVLAGSAFGIGSGGLWLTLWAAMTARAASGDATRFVGTFTCVSKTAQAAAMLVGGYVLAASPYRSALRDPFSAPSLLMAGALALIAVVCLALAIAPVVSRRPSGGRSAKRHRAGRTHRVPGAPPPASSAVRDGRGVPASGSPASR